jgi:type I restriction enzyme M protein
VGESQPHIVLTAPPCLTERRLTMPRLSLAKLERHLYAAADRLRQEGLDAAIYKDYIFGLLFLKRCSDVFETEREKIVGKKVEQGGVREQVEETYGEDPDYYDGFFVPQRSRWAFLNQKLNDAGEPFGSVLDKALGGLSETNESLEHVLDHISFMRTQGNKRVISDEACKDLVRHFSHQRLRNEDFQFSDLLGAAYEFLINMFAESAGKKGGDFYTPRDVIRLMARLLKPQPKMSIYDPTCGSGGMLIISREYVEQSGGDPSNLRLCGQVNDASAWSICRLNMLLHGVRGADIRLQDTLLHPLHLDGEVLERFDRVIANPPFSQNYTRSDMEFPERFQWGWCPTSGKKGDLMFAQHMLHVCKPDGMVATVMPHGVLFRGGAEKEIRRKFLEEDLVEAVIGLPPNLFYGAGIPACILVMRPNYRPHLRNSGKPDTRRGKVLFINADAEFHAGRAQNYLRPEHIEKIASTFDRFEDVPGYARVVEIAEIADPLNDWNLNIRRYVDNAPPPEPHDVRAHLHGGVPVAEIETKQAVFEAIGLAPERLFRKRPKEKAYRDFPAAPFARAGIRPLVENDPGVTGKSATVTVAFDGWWTAHAKRLATLPARRDLNAVRGGFLSSFNTALEPTGALDHFKLAGVIATWWTDSIPDFKTLMENGFRGVLEGWVDTVADALEDDEAAGPAFDPFAHKLVLATMGDYLERIAATKREIARLKGEKEAFEQSNAPDELEEEELAAWNYPKDLERQRKELKADHREALADLAKKNKAASLIKATANQKKAAEAARKALRPVLDALQAIDEAIAPYGEIKDQLAAARSAYRGLLEDFVKVLKSRCDVLKDAECQALVLRLLAGDMRAALDTSLAAKRQDLVRFLEGLWDKYAVTLDSLRGEREKLTEDLASAFETLRYGR